MSDFAFQLYSARFTPLDKAMRIIAEAGYTSVEAFGDNFSDESSFREAIRANHLPVCSMHVRIEDWRDSIAAVLAHADSYGVKSLVIPYLAPEQRPTTANGWQSLADEMSSYAVACNDADISFAWHNHDFEFIPTDDGQIPMDILLVNAPSMNWQIDPAWVFRTGADPLKWISTHIDRISAVHLKDVASSGEGEVEEGWADFGYGVVDWKTLMAVLKSKPDLLYIMEHDKPSDLKRFACRSIEHARAI